MELIIATLQLLLGLGLLLVSADFLLKKVIDIATKTGISASLIAVTFVALGTSMPEFVTSLMASFEDIPDISLGNIIGSNIFNLLVVIGFSCTLKPLQNTYTPIKKEWIFLLLATCLLWILGQDLHLTRLDGFLFLILLSVFLYLIISQREKKSSQNQGQSEPLSSQALFIDWLLLSLSIAFLLAGAHLVLLGAVYLGKSVGMTERIIGLTIVSVGTGLPEMTASMVAAFRKRHDISIANIVGSNIMNTLLITGFASLCRPLVISKDIMKYDYFWLAGVTIGLFVLSIYVNTFIRAFGVFLLLLYGIYLFSLAG